MPELGRLLETHIGAPAGVAVAGPPPTVQLRLAKLTDESHDDDVALPDERPTR